ncbi:MAG: hypothetical protein MK033_07350 [Candidatus Caenarcaniphilales bacterium]|nr:hypothetical protein [Candidatus Caenarcaniphilales bacterium]
MNTKKIFSLLLLLLLSHSAVNAHVESISRNKASENSWIRVKGENLQNASSCFEFPSNADLEAKACKEL